MPDCIPSHQSGGYPVWEIECTVITFEQRCCVVLSESLAVSNARFHRARRVMFHVELREGFLRGDFFLCSVKRASVRSPASHKKGVGGTVARPSPQCCERRNDERA
jgi:hypothetical protein